MAAPLIRRLEDLPPALAASATMEEKSYIARLEGRGLFPFAVTRHYASLALPRRDDPIRRQFFPDPREEEPDPFSLDDPLGEAHHRAARGLVHQYEDRALLLSARSCAGYCRHCFRRVWIAAGAEGLADGSFDRAAVLEYLARRDGIRELLISGGDPLTRGNGWLAGLFRDLRAARPGLALRLCTRAPVTEPSRL
ncbi:MAG: radical SAM protein, partial [Treponema sp.]|nr:radical SAM protein [Treponema sp.]